MAWVDYDFTGAGVWPPTATSTTDTPSVSVVEAATITKVAPERLAPDAVLLQTNLTGTLSQIQDDPDSPDANWMTGGAGVNVLRVSFPTPANSLVAGFTQEFRVRVRPGT